MLLTDSRNTDASQVTPRRARSVRPGLDAEGLLRQGGVHEQVQRGPFVAAA